MGAVHAPVRIWLEPRRLASVAIAGVLIGVVSVLYLGSKGLRLVYYAGILLAVVLTAPWILSVLYLRTERGRAARDGYLARREQSHAAAAIHRTSRRPR
jgi:hypothetical protein